MTLVADADHTHVNKYQDAKLSGTCTRYGCREPAEDGYQLCKPHRADQNERQRKAMKKKRARWAKRRLCTRCGRRRKKGHSWACAVCLAALRRLRPRADHTHVNKSDRIAARTVIDKENRRRFRGQAKRGRMSAADENRLDLEAIEVDVHQFRELLAEAESPEVLRMPRIQRDGVKQVAFGRLGLMLRRAMEMARRNGCPLELGIPGGGDDDLDEDDQE